MTPSADSAFEAWWEKENPPTELELCDRDRELIQRRKEADRKLWQAATAAALASRVQGPSAREILKQWDTVRGQYVDITKCYEALDIWIEEHGITAPTLTWDMVEKILPNEDEFQKWVDKYYAEWGYDSVILTYEWLRDEMKRKCKEK